MLQGSLPKSTAYKTKWAIKIFHEWQINREVEVPVLYSGGAFKDYGDLYKVQSLSTDLANMDANALNLSRNYLWHPKASGFEVTVGSEALNPLDASDKR